MAPTELQLSDPRPRYAGPRAGVVDRARTCPTPGVREQRGAHCCLQRRAPPRIACTPWKAVWPPAAGLALMNMGVTVNEHRASCLVLALTWHPLPEVACDTLGQA